MQHLDREKADFFEGIAFTTDLNYLDEMMDEYGALGFTALDLFKVADLIAERGGLPVFRVEEEE